MPGSSTMMASSFQSEIASDSQLSDPETLPTDIHKLSRAICHTNISSMLKRAHGESPGTGGYSLMLIIPALVAAYSNNLFEFDWMCVLARAGEWRNLKQLGWIMSGWLCCETDNSEHGSWRPRETYSQYSQSVRLPMATRCWLAEWGSQSHLFQHLYVLHRTCHCFWIEDEPILESDCSNCSCSPIVRCYCQTRILFSNCSLQVIVRERHFPSSPWWAHTHRIVHLWINWLWSNLLGAWMTIDCCHLLQLYLYAAEMRYHHLHFMPLPSLVSFGEFDAAAPAILFFEFLPIDWSLFLEPTFVDLSRWYWNCLYWESSIVILTLNWADHRDSCSSNTDNDPSVLCLACQLYHIFASTHSISTSYWTLSVVPFVSTWTFCFWEKLCISLHWWDLHLWCSYLTHHFLPDCCFSSAYSPGSYPYCCLINCFSVFKGLSEASSSISAGQFWVLFVWAVWLEGWKIDCPFCSIEVSLLEDSDPSDFGSGPHLLVLMDALNSRWIWNWWCSSGWQLLVFLCLLLGSLFCPSAFDFVDFAWILLSIVVFSSDFVIPSMSHPLQHITVSPAYSHKDDSSPPLEFIPDPAMTQKTSYRCLCSMAFRYWCWSSLPYDHHHRQRRCADLFPSARLVSNFHKRYPICWEFHPSRPFYPWFYQPSYFFDISH